MTEYEFQRHGEVIAKVPINDDLKVDAKGLVLDKFAKYVRGQKVKKYRVIIYKDFYRALFGRDGTERERTMEFKEGDLRKAKKSKRNNDVINI